MVADGRGVADFARWNGRTSGDSESGTPLGSCWRGSNKRGEHDG
jgi:hypothetical protein